MLVYGPEAIKLFMINSTEHEIFDIYINTLERNRNATLFQWKYLGYCLKY